MYPIFLHHLIIFLELLLTLPKDSAGVGDVKENSQKEAKLDGCPPSGDGTETCSQNLARKGRNFSIG